MTYTTFISIAELKAHLGDAQWAILDCRFSLEDIDRGRRDYLEGHIPGAVYVHLDHDLCTPVIPGVTGRHPLPEPDQLAAVFSRLGIDRQVQVVAYDDWPGASGVVAARLWWSLRWLGHRDVAVLDGGWPAWLDAGGPVQAGDASRPRREFTPHLQPALLATSAEVASLKHDPTSRLFDSRTRDRYRGENEIIDPVAGHIPGAFSAPYGENVAPDGSIKPPAELRQRFTSLLRGAPANQAVFYCGSGVSAAFNVLALAHAGLGDARLYAGSWSEWITDPARGINLGEEPG